MPKPRWPGLTDLTLRLWLVAPLPALLLSAACLLPSWQQHRLPARVRRPRRREQRRVTPDRLLTLRDNVLHEAGLGCAGLVRWQVTPERHPMTGSGTPMGIGRPVRWLTDCKSVVLRALCLG
jgi:hypothetical protein